MPNEFPFNEADLIGGMNETSARAQDQQRLMTFQSPCPSQRITPGWVERLISLGALAFVLTLTGCETAQRGSMLTVYDDIKRQHYNAALAELSSAESYVKPRPELQAEISYLRGQCYEALNRQSEAAGSYKYVVATFPESSYAFQAKERLVVLSQLGF